MTLNYFDLLCQVAMQKLVSEITSDFKHRFTQYVTQSFIPPKRCMSSKMSDRDLHLTYFSRSIYTICDPVIHTTIALVHHEWYQIAMGTLRGVCEREGPCSLLPPLAPCSLPLLPAPSNPPAPTVCVVFSPSEFSLCIDDIKCKYK